jgi:hypothetical protein
MELSQDSLEARMFPDRIEPKVDLSENQQVLSIPACLFQIGKELLRAVERAMEVGEMHSRNVAFPGIPLDLRQQSLCRGGISEKG